MGKPQCGGIALDGTTLKAIEGVICEANTLLIDPDSLVTTCGGVQWDGDSFKTVVANGSPVITYCPNGGQPVSGATPMRANCGVGVDSRFFTLTGKTLSLVAGYLLKVNVTPADATISVLGAESEPVSPISGTTNQFRCSGTVSVTVQKDGYEGKSQTVNMTENREIDVVLDKVWTLTVNTTPADATVVVTQGETVIDPTPAGSHTYICHEAMTHVAVSKTGYVTHEEQGEMVRDKTINVTLQPEG